MLNFCAPQLSDYESYMSSDRDNIVLRWPDSLTCVDAQCRDVTFPCVRTSRALHKREAGSLVFKKMVVSKNWESCAKNTLRVYVSHYCRS